MFDISIRREADSDEQPGMMCKSGSWLAGMFSARFAWERGCMKMYSTVTSGVMEGVVTPKIRRMNK
jgi:hypothetical protein